MAPLKRVRPYQPSQFTGVPALIERTYNEKFRDPLFSEMKGGLFKIAGSGFGKGVALMAALIVGGMALGAACFGGIDAFRLNNVPQDFFGALGTGAQAGLFTLTTGPGLALLGLGGFVGAAQAMKKEKDEVAKAMAEAQERQIKREQSQEMEKAPEVEQLTVPPREITPEEQSADPACRADGFCARLKRRERPASFRDAELARRAQPQTQEATHA